jgi:4-coumarate--CoA ligase
LAHLTRIECAYQLRDSGAKVVIAGPDQLANALEAAKQTALSSESVFAFGDVNESIAKSTGTRKWTQIWVSEEEAGSWHWRKISERKELEETTAIINYSSGQVASFA